VAVLVEVALPPDLPPPAKNEVMVSSVRFQLETMLKRGQPPQMVVTEDEANGFIAATAKSKHAALDKPFLAFRRASVAFSEKRTAVTVERSVMGYWSLYTTCVYAPELKSGRLLGRVEAGRIGRLPIHPKIAQFMGILFGDVATALNPELRLISKMGAVEVHDKSATLLSPTP